MSTHPGFQQRYNILADVRDIQRKINKKKCRVRAGWTAIIVPLLNPPPVQPAACSLQLGDNLLVLSPPLTQQNLNLHWLDEIYSLHPRDFMRPCPTQFTNCHWQFNYWATSPTLCPQQEVPTSAINRPSLVHLCSQF